eukprot:COSAG04_NODE_3472_length_2790_cov_0.897808_7_plen_35_part_01
MVASKEGGGIISVPCVSGCMGGVGGGGVVVVWGGG